MFRRDYLKKQIDQLGQSLESLIDDFEEQKKEKPLEERISLIDEEISAVLGTGAKELSLLAEKDFLFTLIEHEQIKEEHLDQLAELYFIMAEALRAAEKMAEARPFYEKARILFSYRNDRDTTFSFDRYYKIEEIDRYLLH